MRYDIAYIFSGAFTSMFLSIVILISIFSFTYFVLVFVIFVFIHLHTIWLDLWVHDQRLAPIRWWRRYGRAFGRPFKGLEWRSLWRQQEVEASRVWITFCQLQLTFVDPVQENVMTNPRKVDRFTTAFVGWNTAIRCCCQDPACPCQDPVCPTTANWYDNLGFLCVKANQHFARWGKHGNSDFQNT